MKVIARNWVIVLLIWAGIGSLLNAQPWLLNPWNKYYRLNPKAMIETNDSVKVGMLTTLLYENSPLHPAELYDESVRYALLPYFSLKLSKNVDLNFRFFLENKTNRFLNSNKTYYGHYYGSGQGDVEVATLRYQRGPFQLKFGRDYLKLESGFYEALQFSRFQYSYDQLFLKYNYKIFSLQSFYASLDSFYGKNRQLYGHLLQIIPSDKLKIQLMDIGLYGTDSRHLDITLLNPFLPFFIYEYNNHAGGNNTVSLSVDWSVKDNIKLQSEFLLDDYQIEKKDSVDLEPAEFGFSHTLQFLSVFPGFNWYLNYTMVRNRTFNVVNPYEKMIYRHLPMGHFAGNNFWEFKSSLVYSKQDDWASELTLYYRESGEEALYNPFNEDFLKYSVEDGYHESFPFGAIHKQIGFWWENYMTINRNFLIQVTFAYWKHRFNLPENFAWRLALSMKI